MSLWFSAGLLAAQFVYHRWLKDRINPPPLKPTPAQEIQVPRTDEGAAIPLIYGRVRVRAPILAWLGEVSAEPGSVSNGSPDSAAVYRASMFFVLGVGMDDGNGTNAIHGMWQGDDKLSFNPPAAEVPNYGAGGYIGGLVELFDGDASQELVNGSGNGVTAAGLRMLAGGVAAADVPGYRGYTSIFLYQNIGGWYFGASPSIPQYHFEASSYRDVGSYPAVGIYATVGVDSNPVNVIYDILKAKFGKLGISTSLIDFASLQSAGSKLYSEGNGYSRSVEDAGQADVVLQEILEQIDGALDVNPGTGKLVLKLVRNDYDPSSPSFPHLTKNNTAKLLSFAMGGWGDVVNKVRLVYPDRAADYADRSEVAQNLANAVGQDGQVNELVVQMPGVHEQGLAHRLAARELAFNSRPVIKMRVMVGREFLRLMRGDAVKVTWQKPDLDGVIFRVANVERGTLENGMVGLDLVQDYFYTWRDESPRPPAGNYGIDEDLDANVG